MKRANGLDEFYSRLKASGDIELFIDKKGNPTIDYPHVHVIHKNKGDVDVVASKSKDKHVWRKTLSKASGSDVEKAIAEARAKL